MKGEESQLYETLSAIVGLLEVLQQTPDSLITEDDEKDPPLVADTAVISVTAVVIIAITKLGVVKLT
jgi:hypothetical protein